MVMTVKLRTQLLWLTTTLICKKLYAFVATQSSTPYSRTYFMDGPVLVTSLQKIFFNSCDVYFPPKHCLVNVQFCTAISF